MKFINPLSRIFITITIMCFPIGIISILRGAVSNGFICLVFGFAGLVTIIKEKRAEKEDRENKDREK